MALIVNGIGISHPAELFFGIGVCIATPFMIVAALFLFLFTKPAPPYGIGWKSGKLAFGMCATCSLGLLLAGIVPCLYRPDQVPGSWLFAMAVGDAIAAVGLSGLLLIVAFSWKALLDRPGADERAYFRVWIYALPWSIILPFAIYLYRWAGVH